MFPRTCLRIHFRLLQLQQIVDHTMDIVHERFSRHSDDHEWAGRRYRYCSSTGEETALQLRAKVWLPHDPDQTPQTAAQGHLGSKCLSVSLSMGWLYRPRRRGTVAVVCSKCYDWSVPPSGRTSRFKKCLGAGATSDNITRRAATVTQRAVLCDCRETAWTGWKGSGGRWLLSRTGYVRSG